VQPQPAAPELRDGDALVYTGLRRAD